MIQESSRNHLEISRNHPHGPGMAHAVEEWVHTCQPCQEFCPAMPKTPVYPWETVHTLWLWLHIAELFQGQVFPIIVDSFSYWLEVVPALAMTSIVVTCSLRHFVCHPWPASHHQSRQQCIAYFWWISEFHCSQHITGAPFYPSTNEQAESMVYTTGCAGLYMMIGTRGWLTSCKISTEFHTQAPREAQQNCL